MKPGNNVVRGIMVVLFLAALAYFGVYAYKIFFDSYETATVYTYTSQSTIDAQGYVIREETALEDGGSLEEIVVSEGENVAVGDVVARVYSSQTALEQHRELEALQTELERLEYIQSRGTEETDALQLNEEIVDAMTQLKAAAARQDFDDLDDQVEELQDLVFRRDFTYSSSSTLSQQIASVESQIATLETATESAVSTVYAPVAGIFSALVDGYETAFTIDELESLTPETLLEMVGNQGSTSGQELGKIITSFQWYYAAIMSEDVTKELASGDTATVNFEGTSGAQEMTVEYISSADEDGQVVVVFSSRDNLSAVTLLREQNVEVAYGTYTGLRIPTRALRADQETGELGVYRVTGTQAEWVPVELLYTGSDYYLVQAAAEDNLTELEEAELLRAGDEVLVGGKGVYSGKVIE